METIPKHPTHENLFWNFSWVLFRAPFLLFLLQIPQGAAGLFQNLLENRLEREPLLAVVLFFPIFCIASALSSALTFVSLERMARGEPTSVWSAWKTILPKLPILVLTSLLVGAVFVLGFCALVFPAFYFMALYLFVPQLIVTEPRNALSVYLYRSTRLAKSSLWLCMATVFFSILLGIAAYLAAQTLGTWIAGFSDHNTVRHVLFLSTDVSLTMVSGVCIDCWIACLFLRLKQK